MISLIEFCESCRKPGSNAAYRQSLCEYLEIVYAAPPDGKRTHEHVLKMDGYSIKYLAEDRDRVRDMLQYIGSLKHLSPHTQVNHFSIVKSWLELNDINIPRSKMQFIRKRLDVRRSVTNDYAISHDELKRWYEHLSRLGRVMLLIQMSSGMRIGEMLAIKMEDINWKTEPVEIILHDYMVKNDIGRYVFISSEAAGVLREWLTVRDEWLQAACQKSTLSPKSADDDRVIPLIHSTVQSIYITGLKKAGLYQVDEKTNRTTITSHSLRKFFMSQLKTAMPVEMVELLAGHAGYLSDAYRRYPKDQVREAYLQAEYMVSLSTPGNIQEMRDNKEKLNLYMSKTMKMEQEIDKLQEALQRLPGAVDHMNQYMPLIKKNLKK